MNDNVLDASQSNKILKLVHANAIQIHKEGAIENTQRIEKNVWQRNDTWAVLVKAFKQLAPDYER